ncbi:hypothetical protein ES332_A09G077500v1 [Gossypium tomentosum]|uniref:Fungal lipase-type domain-containing protein n=1 Tax=Gossypium tomentosum TaxID=34277 RepID=A0A5D2NZK8_GOSTO|nr:hypothetical protein ES332_A09G077500v1 [Gossypium tomentosum]
MEQKSLIILIILTCLIAPSCGRELQVKHKDRQAVYNRTLATILVEYASALYMSDLTELFTWTCARCGGLTKGFEVIELVVDIQNCLQGFVGVAKDLNAIVIAFRGTQDNRVKDLFWKQLDLKYPGMPNAMVHHGFYTAYHNTTIRPGILYAVKKAKEFYEDLDIMVTGHSMGGAMASFCALDLKSVTNEHDIVPHLPPYYSYFPQKTYHHFPREVWLYNLGLGSVVYQFEKVCDGSGEDPDCSRSVTGSSITDHLNYYGVDLTFIRWRSCRIVMDPRVEEFGKTDDKGNIVLSRDPATLVPRMNTPSNGREATYNA